MTSKLCVILYLFISHSLHWRYIKIALRKYVIKLDKPSFHFKIVEEMSNYINVAAKKLILTPKENLEFSQDLKNIFVLNATKLLPFLA